MRSSAAQTAVTSKVKPSKASSTPARESRIGRGMRQVVADVREEGPPGPQPFDHVDGLRHGEMRRVRTMPQRVENEDVEIGEQPKGRLGNAIAVGQIGKVPKPKAQNRPRRRERWASVSTRIDRR